MNKFTPGPATTRKYSVSGMPVTCVKVDGDGWCFDTGMGTVRFVWRWEERHDGPNLGMNQEGGYNYQVYTTSLQSAVHYAFGFTFGWYSRGLYDKPSSPVLPMGTKIGDS